MLESGRDLEHPGDPRKAGLFLAEVVRVPMPLTQLGRGGVGKVLALWFLGWVGAGDALPLAEREGKGGTQDSGSP